MIYFGEDGVAGLGVNAVWSGVVAVRSRAARCAKNVTGVCVCLPSLTVNLLNGN